MERPEPQRLIYRGKTKDVYALPGGRCLLRFKDDMTGADGVFDPGANAVGLSMEGMGRQNLAVTLHYFRLLERHGIRTHLVAADLKAGTLEALFARPFGRGVEVICRRRAVGSFIRRYGAYIREGDPLPDYVEMTLKDDERGDPLITKEALAALGIMDGDTYERLAEQTRRVTALVAQDLAGRGLELYDIKLEYGQVEGEVLLMDEISPGCMRVMEKGRSVEAMELSARILGSGARDG